MAVRTFNVKLSALIAAYQAHPNYLCMTIMHMARKKPTDIPEYPESQAVIWKFRKLMPELFVPCEEMDEVLYSMTYHFTTDFRRDYEDPRLEMLELIFSEYGDLELEFFISADHS